VTAITLRPAASCVYRRRPLVSPLALAYEPAPPHAGLSARMKSREEQLSWAKQRALLRVHMGAFTAAVAGLRADLAEPP
jgi:hypothetical protein